MGNLIIAVILTILVASQIAVTLNVAAELHKIRKSIRTNMRDIAALQSKIVHLQGDLNTCSRNIAITSKKKRFPGELELYHDGRMAKVQAVFKPRR